MSQETSFSILKRASGDRGHSDLGWLDSWHSFSFGQYHDPDQMGFRSLRVINEDRVAPGKGFATHPHRSMEILSYVVSGELEHKDSLGNGRVIKPGEFQYMSAGDGVLHSEFNPSSSEPAHFLQIWIQPKQTGGEPRYKDFDTASRRVENGLSLLASPDGREGSAEIRQDAEIHFGNLATGLALTVSPDERFPFAWVQLIKGAVAVAGRTLSAGDGAAIESLEFALTGEEDAEFLFFRLA